MYEYLSCCAQYLSCCAFSIIHAMSFKRNFHFSHFFLNSAVIVNAVKGKTILTVSLIFNINKNIVNVTYG